MNKYSSALLAFALGAAASCAPTVSPDQDPCATADGAITLENLMHNSMTQSYESCLSKLRQDAVSELRN